MNPRLASDIPAAASAATTPMAAVAPVFAPSATVNDSRGWTALRALRGAFARMVASIRSLGPYVAIEVLLPGGSIIALALWVYRRWRRARGADAVASAAAPARAPDAAPVARALPLRCLTPCTQQ